MLNSAVEHTQNNPIDPPIVLVIDDEKQVQDAITDVLELLDLSSIGVSDGLTGLNTFKSYIDDIKIILLDLSMPGLSSAETFQRIRSLNSNIPILLTSGVSPSEVPQSLLNDSNCEFLQKPFSINELIERVQHHLANST